VPASSIEDPDRTIPRATIAGTLIAASLYILGTVGVMAILPRDALLHTTAPFADAARVLAGEGAAALVSLGAAISCFGALNGWILMVGQLPRAAAADGVFPRVFGRVSSTGTPASGLIIGGLLSTALIATNYSRGLVELFTFMILLATLSTLVPYAFSTLAVFLIGGNSPAAKPSRSAAVIAALAFAYALWAIAGAGADVVYWGFLLLLAGVPVYVLVKRS
jgi:APA family basic amino acid/polyamine antiporter